MAEVKERPASTLPEMEAAPPKKRRAEKRAVWALGGLVVLLVGLALAGFFAVGYVQQQQQKAAQDEADQALQAQQQANGDLQKQLEDMQAEQDAQEKADLQKQIDQLEADQEEQQDQQAQQPVVIESNEDFAAPDEAPEGVVAVAPSYNVDVATQEEVAVLTAAESYYESAEVGDYNTTWNMLSGADQATYSLGDWDYANNQLDSAAGEFVIYNVEPEPYTTGWYYVDLTVYLADGTSFDRRTEFVYENGSWRHWLTSEEASMFDQALGY